MTTFARKSSTSIAISHSRVLRKSVSSPAAAAVVNDVHELVTRLDATRPLGTVDPLQAHCSSSPRQYIVHEDLVVDFPSAPSKNVPSHDSDSSGSPRLAWTSTRTSVSDGPVYTALRQELAKSKPDDSASGRMSPCSPQASSPRAMDKSTNASVASLEEAKTSNRLLSRALSAVQQRLKQTEAEREQLRRERDYFRQIALRFPFNLPLSAGPNENAHSIGNAGRRFHSSDA